MRWSRGWTDAIDALRGFGRECRLRGVVRILGRPLCFFFQAEDGIRDGRVTGVQTCALPIFETTMDDVRAVMDAAGSDRAVLWTGSTSTGIGVLFAATYPERCSGLIVFDPQAKRSEERRVGKEWRSRWAPTPEKKTRRERGGR